MGLFSGFTGGGGAGGASGGGGGGAAPSGGGGLGGLMGGLFPNMMGGGAKPPGGMQAPKGGAFGGGGPGLINKAPLMSPGEPAPGAPVGGQGGNSVGQAAFATAKQQGMMPVAGYRFNQLGLGGASGSGGSPVAPSGSPAQSLNASNAKYGGQPLQPGGMPAGGLPSNSAPTPVGQANNVSQQVQGPGGFQPRPMQDPRLPAPEGGEGGEGLSKASQIHKNPIDMAAMQQNTANFVVDMAKQPNRMPMTPPQANPLFNQAGLQQQLAGMPGGGGGGGAGAMRGMAGQLAQGLGGQTQIPMSGQSLGGQQTATGMPPLKDGVKTDFMKTQDAYVDKAMTQFKDADPTMLKGLQQSMPELGEKYGINTPERKRMFIAQMGHESGGFKHSEEIGSGQQYEGSKVLGNTQPGDGAKFKGRGPIQLTGRWNYKHYGDKLGVDLVNNPQLASQPEIGWKIAGEYWKSKGLNKFADSGDVKGATKAINGGFNGLEDRQNIYNNLGGI